MKLSFIGEVMLGRDVSKKYIKKEYKLCSDKLIYELKESDFVLANLESPIIDYSIDSEIDNMSFAGKKELLKEVDFVDTFSLANNHINDFEKEGIQSTIDVLDEKNISWNGFYKDDYTPILIEEEKIAIFCCTDVTNKEFDPTYQKKVLWLEDETLDGKIKQYKDKGYFIILYVHGGIMFSRYPNPMFREILFEKINIGANTIITVHPHVVGTMEIYKDCPIFYSLGDFVMDGRSYRRRQSVILNLNVEGGCYKGYDIIPTQINNELQVEALSGSKKEKILKSWYSTSKKLSSSKFYIKDFKKKYRIELILHMYSTIKFRIDDEGVLGLFKVFFSRFKDFKNMFRWLLKDTSKMKHNLEDKKML